MTSEHLEKLVSFKTISGAHEEVAKLYDWVIDNLNLSADHWHMYRDGEWESLYISSQPNNFQPKLLLAAHVDVVPAQDYQFSLQSDEERFYGRGVIDMKYAVAIFMDMWQQLGDQVTNYDFGILLTSDEEVGGEHGTEFCLREGLRPELVLLPDGGSEGVLSLKAKGGVTVKAIAKGHSAHAAYPWLGDSANNTLIDFLVETKKELFNSSSINKFERTLNIGVIDGGQAANMIAGSAEAILNIRYTSIDEGNNTWNYLETTAKKYNIKLEKLYQVEPFLADVNTSGIQSFISTYEKVSNSTLEIGFDHGATDARFYSDHDIPVIVTTPKGGDLHGDNEWVDKKSLATLTRVINQFIKDYTLKP